MTILAAADPANKWIYPPNSLSAPRTARQTPIQAQWTGAGQDNISGQVFALEKGLASDAEILAAKHNLDALLSAVKKELAANPAESIDAKLIRAYAV
ncbi:hypothetical protein NO1_2295, partial [Candidatus Termititenax aidoneus]